MKPPLRFVLFTSRFRPAKSKVWYKRWNFRLVAANGKIVAQSESYNTKHGRDKGVALIRDYAGFAPVVE